MTKHYLEKFEDISTFMFDVDGVLTDGTVGLVPGGEQVRSMYVRDGYALQLAVKMGYRIVIITGGSSQEVKERLLKLGVKDIFLGVDNKLEVFNQYMSKNELEKSEVLYMGDDIPDYLVMKKVGLAVCPSDADHEIKNISDYASEKRGGNGCVRDIIEKVMRVQGKWFTEDEQEEKFKKFFW